MDSVHKDNREWSKILQEALKQHGGNPICAALSTHLQDKSMFDSATVQVHHGCGTSEPKSGLQWANDLGTDILQLSIAVKGSRKLHALLGISKNQHKLGHCFTELQGEEKCALLTSPLFFQHETEYPTSADWNERIIVVYLRLLPSAIENMEQAIANSTSDALPVLGEVMSHFLCHPMGFYAGAHSLNERGAKPFLITTSDHTRTAPTSQPAPTVTAPTAPTTMQAPAAAERAQRQVPALDAALDTAPDEEAPAETPQGDDDTSPDIEEDDESDTEHEADGQVREANDADYSRQVDNDDDGDAGEDDYVEGEDDNVDKTEGNGDNANETEGRKWVGWSIWW
jgi:hypothetical protein